MLYPRLNETQTQLGRTPPQVAVGLRPRLKNKCSSLSLKRSSIKGRGPRRAVMGLQ